MAKGAKQVAGQKGLFAGDTPQMPEGYYSGDKPNPNLRAFVQEHLKERPYDPEMDTYNVPAFDKPIETTKATSIYNMHTYWSKKPHDAIRQYIQHYTQPGDLVLDPFCGSGGTALAALMEDRKAIAIDISPAATFVTSGYCTPVSIDELERRYSALTHAVDAPQVNPYSVECSRCGRRAEIQYVLMSQCFECVKCLRAVPIVDCYDGDSEEFRGRIRQAKLCPHCGERVRTDREKRLGHIAVRALVRCISGCKPKGVYVDLRDTEDEQAKRIMATSEVLHNRAAAVQFGDQPFRYGLETHVRKNLRAVGVDRIRDLFTPRNLVALNEIVSRLDWRHSPTDRALMFVVTSMCLQVSRMVRASNTATLAGTYYVPPEAKEVNAFCSFKGKYELLLRLQDDLSRQLRQPQCLISTQDAISIDLPSDCIDFIFTDPPYGDKFQYAELNAVWDWLLGANTDYWANEIIVNPARQLPELRWVELMKEAMAECYRVLKPGRWISLCYHDTSEGTWASLQDLMAEVGFVSETSDAAVYIDTGQKSYNQLTADKVNKRDLVINFRKPRPGEFRVTCTVIPEDADVQTFRELAGQVIHDYLQGNPGSTKDRVYDDLVSRMVRSGQMEAHNFDVLLREVAEEVPTASGGASRWYLREAEAAELDASEQKAEDAAAAAIEKFIADAVARTGDAGVHYSDLFEHYLYAVQDKPRRVLADWLADYFFKTEAGTWRLPESDEERELKAQSRESGVNRRIKRFASMIDLGVTIPANKIPSSATLAEWIRHAKRAGLYEAGKLLYERGGIDLDQLSETMQAEVEEDYQTCVRALQRAAGADVGTKKRGRRKKAEDDT